MTCGFRSSWRRPKTCAPVTLGTQQFIGSFATNWQAVLAALTLALVPPLVFYAVFSRQLLRGLTAGAIK